MFFIDIIAKVSIILLMIANSSIEKLNSIVDISQVISYYIPIKKVGSNYLALCPFHGEKTPSLSISVQKNLFHCFGCKVGGDVYKFVMEYEKVDFVTAVEKVAKIMNFELTYTDSKNFSYKLDKNIINELNSFYILNLKDDVKSYLYKRGLDDSDIAKFELGYAPESIKSLRFIQNEGVLLEDALKLGLVKRNDKGFYASFINRITFPIRFNNKLIGFGGRIISGDLAKYVNSPQSIIFDKSRIFYGYDLAKPSILKSKKIIVLEGFLDVIFMQKAGFKQSVAVLGTALTKYHIPLIKKDNLEAILCFDGDSAGRAASIKSIKLLLQNSIDCSVVRLSEGVDPADMINSNRVKELRYAFKNRVEGGLYLIDEILKNYELNRPVQKQNAINEIVDFLKTLDKNLALSYKKDIEERLSIKLDDNFLDGIELSENKILKKNIKDIAELSVIKTMIVNKNMLLFFKKHSTSKIFKFHKTIFDEFLEFKDQSPKVRELLLDESIKVLDLEHFHKSLIDLKIAHLNSLKIAIKKSNVKDKLEKIIKIEKIIINLRNKYE